jgi:hypothetical protein
MRKIAFILIILTIPVYILGQEFKTVRDGIEYAEVTRGTEKEPVHINLLRLDLRKVRLDVVHAMDAAIGLEKTSSIASRHGAFAAINAGFFKMDGLYKGDAAGVLQIDGSLLSESFNNRIALFISNLSDRTETYIKHSDLRSKISIKGKEFEIGRNRQRGENDIVVYEYGFHRTTLTDRNGAEFVVKSRKVSAVYYDSGSSQIPPDGYIISVTGAKRQELLNLLKVGTKVHLLSTFGLSLRGSDATTLSEDIVGGVPQLIKNGKIDITWEQEKINKDFVTTRHPRTAVAKLKDGKFLMVTVDGRQPGYSVGMNLEELAAFLLEQGAVDAMNLDGGGSTTMFLDGKVMNKPSDKEGERSVSDAILVTPRKSLK